MFRVHISYAKTVADSISDKFSNTVSRVIARNKEIAGNNKYGRIMGANCLQRWELFIPMSQKTVLRACINAKKKIINHHHCCEM
jgi:uncharacterized protein YggL (DUF469 family)